MEFKGRIFFQKRSSGVLLWQRKRKRARREKNPFESVSLKLQDPGGSGQEEGVSTGCLVLPFLFPTDSLHHPQWFSTAHHTFLTHIPLYVPAPICVHQIFTVNTRASFELAYL